MTETPKSTPEVRLESLVAVMQTCLALLDAESVLLWRNPAFARWLGAHSQDVVGQPIFHVLGTDDAESLRLQAMLDRVRDGHSVRSEHLVCGRERGSPRTLAIDLNPAGDGCFLLEVLDVDAPGFANRDQQLAEQAEITSALAGVGFWAIDVATGIVRAGRAHGGVFRHSDADHDGRPVEKFFACIDKRDRPAFVEARLNSLKRSDSVAIEFRLMPPEGGPGRVMMSRMRSRRSPDGRAVEVVGVSLDITDQRASELASDELRERMALATEVAGIGTWDRDLVTGISRWDNQMYALRGLLPGQGDPDVLRSTLLHPDDFVAMEAKIARSIELALPYVHEFRVRMPDGGWRWLTSRGKVLLDPAGKPTRMLGVNFDITEQKRAAEALRAQAAAESANQAKSEFLSHMSHELRTPLNAILGFAQLLRVDRKEPPTAGQEQRIERIEHAGWHLLELINDVLDLSRIEAGAMRLSEDRVDLAALVAEAVHLVDALARERSVTVFQPVEAAPAMVVADRMRLRQVLINLLTNAIKYNRESGEVFISIEGAVTKAQAYVVSVRDTGRGMTDEQLGELFQPFNRLGAEKLGIEGTGIGLAISRKLVEAMGGSVGVHSDPGTGSTFRVMIPAAAALGESVVSVGTEHEAGGRILRVRPEVLGSILYVEDNPVNAILIRDYLSFRPGIRLEIVATAKEGFDVALGMQPNLVLLDIGLPDFDGFELFRRLQNAWTAPHALCCVALSANAMSGDAQRAVRMGLADYWTKPIDPEKFLGGIDVLLAECAPLR